jgi:hypothetical protein
MAPLTHTVTFGTTLTPEQARERALGWFAGYQHKVAQDSADHLEVKTGSQAKMRLLGGAFIAGSSLPTLTTLTIRPGAAGGSDVEVVSRDTVTVGVKTGMKKKYQRWLEEIGAGLQQALA